jgi:hypothetical protein
MTQFCRSTFISSQAHLVVYIAVYTSDLKSLIQRVEDFEGWRYARKATIGATTADVPYDQAEWGKKQRLFEAALDLHRRMLHYEQCLLDNASHEGLTDLAGNDVAIVEVSPLEQQEDEPENDEDKEH